MTNNEILNSLANLISNANSINSIGIDTAFNIFLEFSINKCRPDTIKFYRKQFQILKRALSQLGIEHTKEITKLNYNKIINVLSYFNYSNASINKVMDLLKRIIKVCNDLDYISHNEIAGIKKLKEDIPQIKIIKKDMAINIFNYLFSLKPTPVNLRNILIILLLSDTGVRMNELRHIKLKDVNLDNNSIYLNFTKTGKPRYVFFTDITKHYINLFLKYHNDNEYLLIEFNKGGIISNNPIYSFIKQIKNALNISDDVSLSPHKWRHTLATELITKNVNLNSVMQVLGHTQFSTTKRYLHVANDIIKNDVLAALESKKK